MSELGKINELETALCIKQCDFNELWESKVSIDKFTSFGICLLRSLEYQIRCIRRELIILISKQIKKSKIYD